MKINTAWDLSRFYKSINDPQIEIDKELVKKEILAFVKKWKDRNDYTSDPKILLQALQEFEKISDPGADNGKISAYFSLSTSLNSKDIALKAKANLLDDFFTKLDNEIEFFMHRISKIPEKAQKIFLNSQELNEYRYFLKQLFDSAKYLLSEEQEKILNLKEKGSYSNWVSMISDFLKEQEAEIIDESGKKIKANFSTIQTLLSSSKKLVRSEANKAYCKIINKFVNPAERELNSVLEYKKLEDELRGYKKPYSSTLFGDDVEEKVIESMLKNVSDNFDVSQKYYSLKAKLFGVEKLEYYERNLEYGKTTKKYEFAEAYNLVHSTFSELNPDFGEIFKTQFANSAVDVFPKVAKSTGAFCTHASKNINSFVLLNYTNRIEDVLTLAHEMGHSVNHELSRKSVSPFYMDTSIATAEVASTFFEDFALKKLLKKADDETKLSLLMQKLNDDISTIFRQVACFKFEIDLHTKYREMGFLDLKTIGELFEKNMRAYMGESINYTNDSKNWWVYWPHIRYYFYVYSYASGLLISKTLQAEVEKDSHFIEKIKRFLESGSKDSPKNLFLNMGIDISNSEFWKEGVEECRTLLIEAETLARKLKKI